MNEQGMTHWFVDNHFEASSMARWLPPSCFLVPELVKFGQKLGAWFKASSSVATNMAGNILTSSQKYQVLSTGNVPTSRPKYLVVASC